MRISEQGQITIPKHLRDRFGNEFQCRSRDYTNPARSAHPKAGGW